MSSEVKIRRFQIKIKLSVNSKPLSVQCFLALGNLSNDDEAAENDPWKKVEMPKVVEVPVQNCQVEEVVVPPGNCDMGTPPPGDVIGEDVDDECEEWEQVPNNGYGCNCDDDLPLPETTPYLPDVDDTNIDPPVEYPDVAPIDQPPVPY